MNKAEAVIIGTGLYKPPYQISNEELVHSFNEYVNATNAKNQADILKGKTEPLQESNADFIVKASGIRTRYVVEKQGILDSNIMCPKLHERDNEAISIQAEMAVVAAKEAMQTAGITADDIDVVLCAASNMMRPYPAMAIEIQHYLGIKGYAYDLNVACSSATFGLQAAADAIQNGHARRVLMVNPEICTGHLNFRDRESHFIFGDACTAVILAREDLVTTNTQHSFKIISSKLITQYSNNIRNNAGFLNRTCPENREAVDKLFVQNGRKVFKEVSLMVVEHLQSHLQSGQLIPSDLQRIWLHQANATMNNLILEKLMGKTLTLEQAPLILDTFANTSSAGCIIAFHQSHQNLVPGNIGLLCSFGAGYSIGSVLIEKI